MKPCEPDTTRGLRSGRHESRPRNGADPHREPDSRLTNSAPLSARSALEATAQRIAAAAMALDGADQVSITLFEPPAVMRRIGLATRLQTPAASDELLPATRVAYLRARASLGPWLDRWVPRPEDGTYGVALRDAGLRAVLYIPMVDAGEPRVLMAIASARRDGLARLARQLEPALKLAAAARALLMLRLDALVEDSRAREAVQDVISRRLFRPVYQPIAALGSGIPEGFEGLSRFTDGSQSRDLFSAAQRVGLGLALEEATLEASLAGADRLPPDRWLGLHVSPELIMERDTFVRLLARRRRHMVLLVSERHEVADHAALAARVTELGSHVRLGVDDVGAGTADFRHLVGWRPRLVKLDGRLVRGIEGDADRQAVLQGLLHLSRSSGFELVAGGIETRAERLTLQRLGLRLGMGYLLGGPAEPVL